MFTVHPQNRENIECLTSYNNNNKKNVLKATTLQVKKLVSLIREKSDLHSEASTATVSTAMTSTKATALRASEEASTATVSTPITSSTATALRASEETTVSAQP